MRVLDRRVSFDERSRGYDIRTLLTTDQPRSYTWSCAPAFDQRNEGACVGHGWAHEAAARPVVLPATQADAFALYREAQRLDIWEGEDYDGTSVLAGAKAMQARGWLNTYRWAFNRDDALTAISRHGPAVIGVWWWTGMMEPDSQGRIYPTGQREGGHCVLVRGVNVKARTVRIRQSWGNIGPLGPDVLLDWDDFGTVLADEGECAIPVRR
jgi:hypothetical protein